MKQKVIVAVCRGNIGRSPFAEAVINQELIERKLDSQFRVISRGIQGTAIDTKPVSFPNITFYQELYRDAKPTLDKFGIDMSRHVSTPIDIADAEQSDILLAMDSKTQDGLIKLFPNQGHKIHLVSELIGEHRDIADPEGVSIQEIQEQIFHDL